MGNHARRRRLGGAFGVLLFACATLVAPGLHLLLEHGHAPDAPRASFVLGGEHVERKPHRHDDGRTHAHRAPRDRGEADPRPAAPRHHHQGDRDGGHGGHALEHFGVALHQATIFVHILPASSACELAAISIRDRLVIAGAWSPRLTRGPPPSLPSS